MVCTDSIHQTPQSSEQEILGRTLPSLLDEACDRLPNPQAFHQWADQEWQPLSNLAFQTRVEAIASGLFHLGLTKGDRIALLMHSDLHFCLTDLASLLANLVNVPIDLTQTLEQIIFVLQHSEAKALVISNLELLGQIIPYLKEVTSLQFVIVATVPDDWEQVRLQWLTQPLEQNENPPCEGLDSACLAIPSALHPVHLDRPHGTLPHCIQLLSLNDVQNRGNYSRSASLLQQFRDSLKSTDLATIIYIPDETGQLQGVMLTHENLSGNAIASFAAISDLVQGSSEIVLSFLPLNHVLARTLLYGHIYYGHTIYFSNAAHVLKHLKDVRPTILATVPILIEKIYSKIVEKGSKSSKFERILFNWALDLTQRYELGVSLTGLYALSLRLADRLVLSKWRAVFGDRLKYLICGGAALRAELANAFAAAGVTILQGYGLTQASAVVCCNRGLQNRAGTVGVPIAGVEIKIAEDDEILVRGAYVSPGYYHNPEATRSLIDSDGWLHTGDRGRFTSDGFLQITGIKKALFKLSTGKYIAPLPIENRLKESVYVRQAIVVGSEQKFCAVLIVPNLEALHRYALETGIDPTDAEWLNHPCVTALYQSIVDAANCHLPYWATVKRFQLIQIGVEEGSDRTQVIQTFATEIATLFRDSTAPNNKILTTVCPTLPATSCPAFAQSLNPRLTTS